MKRLYFPLCLLFWICSSRVEAQYRFACDENFCAAKVGPCPELDCENGRLVKNATQCGCCDVCIKSLGKGETCSNFEYAVIPTAECGHGLVCNDGICAEAFTKCIRDQMDYDSADGIGELTTGKPRPVCDYFGLYEPVTCKPGMLCFCVDKQGRRIFGTDSSRNKNEMNCNCSLEYAEFRRDLAPDQFLRCLPNGNYDPLQCTDEYCYCVGSDDQLDGRAVEAGTHIANLKCYNYDRHKNDDDFLRSKCIRERRTLQEQIDQYAAEDIMVVGVDLPTCDLDGSFAPVQHKKNRSYCVKKDGSRYEEGYGVARNSEAAKNMNCRCAREKDILQEEEQLDRVTQIFAQYRCAENGNYLPVQCVGSVCFCVDEMGFQENEAVLMYKHTSLSCYKREYEEYLE